MGKSSSREFLYDPESTGVLIIAARIGLRTEQGIITHVSGNDNSLIPLYITGADITGRLSLVTDKWNPTFD
jgi:hypothetical protein